MPVVRIRLDPVVNASDKFKFTGKMSAIRRGVAEIIACDEPGGGLVAGDIEVHINDGSPADDNAAEVFVDIEARWYQSREDNLKQRADAVRDLIKGLLGPNNPLTVGVWLKLVNAAYSE
jgi:hypothetical protein